jgi:hypothetical protein
MREKQTGYLGIEETLSTISIARRTMTPKKRGSEGSGRKNFKQRTQSPLKSAARAAAPATVYALELFEFDFCQVEMVEVVEVFFA